jgi:5'-3' exonuclease
MSCEWMLIDGPSLIFRAYYGALRQADADDKRPVNAVASFLERLARLIVQRRPRRLAVTEDRAWRPGWRVALIPTYKAHRTAEPVPPPLAPQIPIIYEIMSAIGIDVVGADEHEAEDVIASVSRRASGTIEIVSGDRDLFALVEDPRVRVLYPEKAGLAVIDEDEVTRRYDVPGRRYADFAILRGDPSDGLPGLKGVGSVGAAAMIRRHGDIGGVLRERRLNDADRDYLTRALQVVQPVDDLPIELPRGRRDAYPVDGSRLQSLAARHQAHDACLRLLAGLSSLAAPAEPPG